MNKFYVDFFFLLRDSYRGTCKPLDDYQNLWQIIIIFLSTKEGHFWVRNEKDSFMNLNPISWIFFLQRGHNFLDNIVPKRRVWGLTQVIRILANSLDRPIRLLIYLLLGNGEYDFMKLLLNSKHRPSVQMLLRFSNYSRVPNINKQVVYLFVWDIIV